MIEAAETIVHDDRPTPKQVLFEQMYFLRNQFNKITKKIYETLKIEGNGTAALELLKIQTRMRYDLVDVASKLAPYTDPKMESIEVKTTIEHKFVVHTPVKVRSTKDFLSQFSKDTSPIILGEGKAYDITEASHTVNVEGRNRNIEEQDYSMPEDDEIKPEYFDQD